VPWWSWSAAALSVDWPRIVALLACCSSFVCLMLEVCFGFVQAPVAFGCPGSLSFAGRRLSNSVSAVGF
jgi:hypothetical protein